MRKQKNRHMKLTKHNKILICTVGTCLSLIVIYLCISLYFRYHFCFDTTVSCINVSGDTVKEVNEKMPLKISQYTLELIERGDSKEQIKGLDIDLKYDSNGKVEELKEQQNTLTWFALLFDKKTFKVENVVTYDEGLLKKCIDNLACFDSKNIIEPKNPTFKYGSNGYEIVSESPGRKINKNILYAGIEKAIIKGETELNLEDLNCYEVPEYTANSKRVIDCKEKLNKYVSTKITYTFGDKCEVLNGDMINKWLKINEDYEIELDEKDIKNYLNNLCNTYDTAGSTREFVTSLGSSLKISGGDYGWIIDKEGELKELVSIITSGKTVTKEPKYVQRAITHTNYDIGNTYVEINLSSQHLWYYKNGTLITEGNVVTGNVSNEHGTPEGIYSLKYKQRDTVLRGPGYNSPVSFWMPFNGGIGIHDASWRSEFGGNIYKTNGSHGCINAPYGVANAIFNSIEEGTPVVCYY